MFPANTFPQIIIREMLKNILKNTYSVDICFRTAYVNILVDIVRLKYLLAMNNWVRYINRGLHNKANIRKGSYKKAS